MISCLSRGRRRSISSRSLDEIGWDDMRVAFFALALGDRIRQRSAVCERELMMDMNKGANTQGND